MSSQTWPKIFLLLLVVVVGLAACTAPGTGNPVNSSSQGTSQAITAPPPKTSTPTPTATLPPTEVLPSLTPTPSIDAQSVLFACLSKRVDDFGPAGPWNALEDAIVTRPSEGGMEIPGGSYHVCAYALVANQPLSLALQLAIGSEPFGEIPFRESDVGPYHYFALIDENLPSRYTILNAQGLTVIEMAVLGPDGQVMRQDQLKILGKTPKPQPTPTKKKG